MNMEPVQGSGSQPESTHEICWFTPQNQHWVETTVPAKSRRSLVEVAPSLRGLRWFTHKTDGFLGWVTKLRPKARRTETGFGCAGSFEERDTWHNCGACVRWKQGCGGCVSTQWEYPLLDQSVLEGCVSFFLSCRVAWSFGSTGRLHI
jgi:hypothetical protein